MIDEKDSAWKSVTESMLHESLHDIAISIEKRKQERFYEQIRAIEAKHADKPKKKREKKILKEVHKTILSNLSRDLDEKNDARECFKSALASLHQAPPNETRIHSMEDVSFEDFKTMSDSDLIERIKGR